MALTSGKALTAAEKAVQDAGSETQAFARNAFVYPVKHSGKVQIWRQPQGSEPEAAHAEPGERLGVRTGRQAVGNHPRVRVLGEKCAGHRVVQGTIGGGLERDIAVDELPGDARAEHPVEFGQEL